jgi:hypothetical protein
MTIETTNPDDRTQRAESAVRLGLRFLRQQWPLLVPISMVLLLPIFWHKRLEAGDLASHTYNAWLAQLIERGQAPGLYIARQWNNILVDVALARVASWLGFAAAERIVVSACVLVFFWGTFALIAAASRRAPWFLTPAIAMLTYSWTFQMGFMNYYLSLGFGFLAIALFWRGRVLDWVVGIFLLALTLLAHPMGFICVLGMVAYVTLAEKMSGWRRWALLAAAFTAVFAVHYYIVHHFRTQYWETSIFYLMNGADQLALYGERYVKLAMVALVLGTAAFLYDRRRERMDTGPQWRFRTPLELWAILLFTAAMIPELIQLPQYAGPIGLPVSRLTSITAAMGLCVLGHMRPRKWHLAGFAAIAAVYFAFMYQDTDTLNKMEAQAEELVAALPQGRRVTATIWPLPDSRILFVNHIVDRACIGRCFTYSNYEPSSGQFRIRVRPGSPVVTDSAEASEAMEEGEYVVRPEDLPMTQIYQCDANDLTRLCARDLVAGEKNGQIGYRPPGVP